MKNPHIIVGSGRRCVCGSYSGRAIGCAEVISAIEHLEHFGDDRQKDSLAVLRAVIDPLIEDCADEYDITINSKPVKSRPTISYEDIIEKVGAKPGSILTMTYFVRSPNRQGCLTPGQFVVAETGMHITAVDTSNA